MADLFGRKPILCLDFDGVCHSYTSGWKGAEVIPDAPVPGVDRFIQAASMHFEVAIYSSRSCQDGGLQAMRTWFEKWFPGITSLLCFPQQKPAAFVGIDDRVITFTGEWPSVEALRGFQPWNKRTVG